MATPTTSANLHAQPQSQSWSRDWSNLRSAEPGSAFRGLSKGRGTRGGTRGARALSRPPSSLAIKDPKLPHPESLDIYVSQPDVSTPKPEPTPLRKGGPATQTGTSNTTLEKPAVNSNGRAPKPKTPSRRASRTVPVSTVASVSPTPDSVQNVLSTPSRNSNRHRRQHVKPPIIGTTKSSISPSTSLRPHKPSTASVSSSIPPRKDIPPHLAAAHEAEIRQGVDAFVERVRAVAMAENRPSTPGSHIDWAGDDDDSLPDLDDWGVTTTNTSVCDKEEQISPILADALKPLPEPHTEGDTEDDEQHRMEPLDDNRNNEIISTANVASKTIVHVEQPTLHPSLPPKPVAAMESLRASSARANLPFKPAPIIGGEEPITSRGEGLSQSIHASSPAGEALTLGSSSSEKGLAASIHAYNNLPESHSAPSQLSSGAPCCAHEFTPSHGRSKTEGRAFPHSRTALATVANEPVVRSGTSLAFGPHAHTHARHYSTPPGGAAQRALHNARPVITGEAISRLARTIGGMPVIPRAHSVAVAVAKD